MILATFCCSVAPIRDVLERQRGQVFISQLQDDLIRPHFMS